MTGAAVTDGLSAAIRVPADPAALALVRLFATAIGREADLEEEDVEDLKLALTEVCSAAIEAATGDHDAVTVEVGWSADPVELDVHVVSTSTFSTGPGSSDRAGLLDALGVKLRGTDDGRGVAFAPPGGRVTVGGVRGCPPVRLGIPRTCASSISASPLDPSPSRTRVTHWTIWPGSRHRRPSRTLVCW